MRRHITPITIVGNLILFAVLGLNMFNSMEAARERR